MSTVMMWQNVVAEGRGTDVSNAVLTLGSGMLFILWSQLLTKAGERRAPRQVRGRMGVESPATTGSHSPERT